MCIARFRNEKNSTDEQPLHSDVDLYSTYWNRQSALGDFSYFEPINSTEFIEMRYIDDSGVFV